MRKAILETILVLTICVVLAVIAIHVIRFLDRTGRAIDRLPETLDNRLAVELERTREASKAEISETRKILQVQIDGVRSDLVVQIDRLREDSKTLVEKVGTLADNRLASIQDDVNHKLNVLSDRIDEELSLSGEEIRGLIQSSNRMVQLITPQVLGTTAAAKVAAGELATTMRTWRRETPEIAANVRETTANVKQATKISKWQKLLIFGAAAAGIAGILK